MQPKKNKRGLLVLTSCTVLSKLQDSELIQTQIVIQTKNEKFLLGRRSHGGGPDGRVHGGAGESNRVYPNHCLVISEIVNTLDRSL